MKRKPIEHDHAFLQSLDVVQRAYFIQRETDRSVRLQAALRALSQGISEVSALNGETLDVVLGVAT